MPHGRTDRTRKDTKPDVGVEVNKQTMSANAKKQSFRPAEDWCKMHRKFYAVPLTQLGRSGSGCPELRPKFLVDCSEFGWELCLVGDRIYIFVEQHNMVYPDTTS